METRPPVSFVVPVRNGERWIREVLAGIERQRDGRPMEIVVVDDRSEDRTPEILRTLDATDVRVIAGRGLGAAAALHDAINLVIQEPERWRAEAVRAAFRVRELFGNEPVCTRLVDLYRAILSRDWTPLWKPPEMRQD